MIRKIGKPNRANRQLRNVGGRDEEGEFVARVHLRQTNPAVQSFDFVRRDHSPCSRNRRSTGATVAFGSSSTHRRAGLSSAKVNQ